MLAQPLPYVNILVVLLYLLITVLLGYLGWRRTKTASDYLVAGRKTHPFIMALSYGATFISTSAIVGFGGVAGLFGMSLLWLTFLNIFVGIFVAFVLLGGRARLMGHHLDAHTFPEFIGRRFQSRFMQVFAGLVIFVFMPLYAAAVLIGGAEFVATSFFPTMENGYHAALLIFAVITAAYVIAGGLKGVMYTDTFQGIIMFVGMGILLLYAYERVGGVTEGHQALTDLKDLVPGSLAAIGHQGWSSFPAFGFGEKKYDLWWIVVTTIVMGVGIGVLAQPQLIVRFMTVKSKRELNRAALVGGIFILLMTGVAFTVGALSNAYFSQHGALMTGRIAAIPSARTPDGKPVDVKALDAKALQAKALEARGHVVLQLVVKKDEAGPWAPALDDKGKPKMAPVVLDAAQPFLEDAAGDGAAPLAQGRSISIVYAKGNPDQIIPTFITSAMPKWFGLVFMLTLLAAAMSTLSSQFHTLGTSMGRDVFEQLAGGSAPAQSGRTVLIVRIAIIIGLIVATTIGYYTRGNYIIARATAIFFGLCASTFLPTFVGGLFWKRMTKAGAIASMLSGFLVTSFWLLFVKTAEAKGIGLVQWVTGGKESLFQEWVTAGGATVLKDISNWPVVDPLVVALPLSILAAILVSLVTRPPAPAHVEKCFRKTAPTTRV
ncbi:MAG: sodium:solute symporter family protein [Planctomycetota bacterium]|nr:sodium:solute symporter family protein [Planctomycetota bacterium]